MKTPALRLTRTCLASAALALSMPLWAAGPGDTAVQRGTGHDATYQQERAACTAMSNPESRSNCLRDLGAARQQMQRTGHRPAPSSETLERNATERCAVHKDLEARAICDRMARGEGNTSGSVSGGGVIRELETVVPGTPAPALSPPVQPMRP